MTKAKRELQDLGFGMHLVPLTRGAFALIDSVDAERIGAHNWSLWIGKSNKSPYAMSCVDGKHVYMHRFIAGESADTEVDHRDGDGLDNRRSNLRPATRCENARNKGLYSNNIAGIKGVNETRPGWWRARIRVNGKLLHLGYHRTPEAAQDAYADAADRFFGAFARTA